MALRQFVADSSLIYVLIRVRIDKIKSLDLNSQ